MALPVWPLAPALPDDPLIESYQLTVMDELLRSDMDCGPARTRRRFTSILHRVQMSMLMEEPQFLLFKGFYSGTLRHGTLQFQMPIFQGMTFVSARVRFEQPYTADDIAVDMTKVNMSLIAFNLII